MAQTNSIIPLDLDSQKASSLYLICKVFDDITIYDINRATELLNLKITEASETPEKLDLAEEIQTITQSLEISRLLLDDSNEIKQELAQILIELEHPPEKTKSIFKATDGEIKRYSTNN